MYFRMLRLEVMINRKRLGLLILAGVGVALVMGVSFYVWHYIKAPFDNKIIPSFWDQLAYFYCGIPPFTPSRQESFEMPIAYLITNLVLLFALGNTTVSVFEPYGYELFTRIPKRTVLVAGTLFVGGYGSGSRAGGHNRDNSGALPCCGWIIFNL